MQAVKVVILMALLAKAAVIAQNLVTPQVIAGAKPGTCPSQEDRDAAHRNVRSAALSVLQRNNTNNRITFHCGAGQWYHVAYLMVACKGHFLQSYFHYTNALPL